MIKKKKGLTWLVLIGSITSSLFGLGCLTSSSSNWQINKSNYTVSNQKIERTIKQSDVYNELKSPRSLNSSKQFGQLVNQENQTDNKVANNYNQATRKNKDDVFASKLQVEFVIAPFKEYMALVDLGDHQFDEIVDVPEEVNFVRKNAFQNSRAYLVHFWRDGTIKIAGGAQLPTKAQYNVYDVETAMQLVGVGVTDVITVRQDQTKIQAIDGLIYQYTGMNGPRTLIGLTSSAQEEGELTIPHDINLVAEGALDNSQATLIKFKSDDPICFRGKVPNTEYEVESTQTAINLIKAGAKQNIVLKSKKTYFSQDDIKDFAFEFNNGQVILTGLNESSQDQDTLQIPAYVEQIATGVLDQFKGRTVLFLSLEEVVVHGKVPNSLYYYSKNRKTIDRLIEAGAQKDRAILLARLGDAKYFTAAVIVSVLAGTTILLSLGWLALYLYNRRKKSKNRPTSNCRPLALT